MENTEGVQEVAKIKTYTIVVTEYTDGTTNLRRTNDGFYPLELLGLCQLTSLDIMEQLKGCVTPNTIERRFVVDDKK